MTKDQIVAEFKDMHDSIQAAREALSRGQAIDLTGIDGRIEAAVAAVAGLDHEDALEVRPVLSALLDDLQGFARALETEIGEIGDGDEKADGDGT